MKTLENVILDTTEYGDATIYSIQDFKKKLKEKDKWEDFIEDGFEEFLHDNFDYQTIFEWNEADKEAKINEFIDDFVGYVQYGDYEERGYSYFENLSITDNLLTK